MIKTKSFVSLVVVIILVLSGCQKIENLLDVTFNAEYSVDLEAVIPPISNTKQADAIFSASATIDPNSNSKFSQYAEKIKDIEITSISAEILSISKPVTLKVASIAVFSESRNAAWNFTNEILTAGKILSLSNSSNQWTIIQNIIKDKETFTIYIDGETDVDDVSFTVEVTVKTKVTANPLNN